MKEVLDRREFIKLGLACGCALIPTLSGGCSENAAGATKSTGAVKFRTQKGTAGCAQCENAVKVMLEDKERLAALEKHFPEGSEVVFYVRRHKPDAELVKNAIAVGNCASPVAKRSIASVPGCRAEIRPAYIFKHIIEQLEKNKKPISF